METDCRMRLIELLEVLHIERNGRDLAIGRRAVGLLLQGRLGEADVVHRLGVEVLDEGEGIGPRGEVGELELDLRPLLRGYRVHEVVIDEGDRVDEGLVVAA